MAEGSENYHEPVNELSDRTRDIHRAIVTLIEELQAIDWYQQRMDACKDENLKKIFRHNMNEEKEHASMSLEWIRRQDTRLSKKLSNYLFTEKPIVAEEEDD